MTEQHEQDTPFNFAMLYYMGLNKLQDEKIEAKQRGMADYYQALRDIYIRISFKIIKKEKDKIEEMFTKAKKTIRTPIDRRTSDQSMPIVNAIASEQLEDIDIELWRLMDKYKMIFPRMEHKQGLDHLYKKYGLGKNGKEN